MPWVDTSLETIRNRIKQDFLAYINNVDDAPLRRSVENVWVYVLANASYSLHQFIRWASRQFPPSEDSDLDSLLRWSNDLLTVPRVAASPATGNVTFYGVDTTAIPAGTEIANRDGHAFTTDSPLSISGTSITGAVTAVVAGKDGNTEAGASVFLSQSIPGIQNNAVVAAGGLTGGADAENKFGVLSRLRTRMKTPPRGGATGDYVAWATEVAGVSRAFEYPQDPTAGWMTVVVVDDSMTDLIPGGATVTAAQSNIDAKRPVIMGGCIVTAPVKEALLLQWTGLVPNDAPTRASLEGAVNAWIRATSEPGRRLAKSEIENAAQSASGVAEVTLAFPVTDVYPTSPYGVKTNISHGYV